MNWKLRMMVTLLSGGMLAVAPACSDTADDAGNQETPDAGQDASETDEDTGGTPGEEDVTEEPEDIENDTEPDPPAEQLKITSMSYQMITEGCPTSSCGSDISINAVSHRITWARNGSGPSYGISADDAQHFIDNVLTDATHERMLNGWDCPEPAEEREADYQFEGTVLNGETYDQAIQDITGCVEAGDEDVMALIAVFEELRDKYYETE